MTTTFVLICFLFFAFSNPAKAIYKKFKAPTLLHKTESLIQIAKKKRRFLDVTLKCDKTMANCFVSLPNDEKKHPCILILDGVLTGKDCLLCLQDHDTFGLASYDYPSVLKEYKGKSVFLKSFPLRKAAINVPYQVLSIIHWLEEQKNIEKPIILMGVSYGAVFIPAIYHLAKMDNIKLGPAIMAYAGAGLYDLLKANVGGRFQKTKAFLASLLFRPLEPAFHTDFMNNDILLIEGTNDHKISKKAKEALEKALGKKKVTIKTVRSGHIQPKNEELILDIYRLTEEWLKRRS